MWKVEKEWSSLKKVKEYIDRQKINKWKWECENYTKWEGKAERWEHEKERKTQKQIKMK